MSLVRRRGIGAAVVLLVGGAVATSLIMGSADRPVDIRLVAPDPAQETVSASMTTTLPAVAPPTAGTTETRPVAAPVNTATNPPTPPPATTTSLRGLLPELIDGLCDYVYYDSKGKQQCVPWLLDMKDACAWLHAQGIDKIKVRGRDGYNLDLDLDGIACA
jgi:hypothetical protein